MNKWIVLMMFLIASIGISPAKATCTAGGNTNLGRGFHLGEALGRSENVYQAMSGMGATLSRFGIALEACKGCSRYEWPKRGIDELMRQLEFANRNNMRVVVVLAPPPEPMSELWKSADLQKSVEDIWRWLAEQLKGRTEVAGFDLINEPHPNGLNFRDKQARWVAFAERLIRTIRSVDPSRTIVFEPSPGARPMAFEYVHRLPFENIVYSVHYYEPFEFTHQRIGDKRFVDTVDYPGVVIDQGLWDLARLKATLAPVKRFADSSGVEIYVGEFGAIRWAPNRARERYLKDLTVLFSEYSWSWTYHAYREWHGWDAEMSDVDRDRSRRSSEPAFSILRDALNECSKPAGSK